MKASLSEIEFHNLILNGDNLSLAKLYDLYGEQVIVSLKQWYPQVASRDEALILEAVNEAFWGYYNNPITFDPDRNTLKRFLEIAAERDLKNILVREKRYLKRDSLPEDVELQDNFWNKIIGTKDATDYDIIENEILELIDLELSKLFKNPEDVQMAKMILSNERETNSFAEIIGILDIPIEEQQKIVKQHKDRIKKVLERNEFKLKIERILQ